MPQPASELAIPSTARADHVSAAQVSMESNSAATRTMRDYHLVILIFAMSVVTAAFALQLDGVAGVRSSWPSFRLPPLCASHAILGVDCPGCGLTRSFIALASGHFEQSFRFHRVGWLVALAVLLQIPYRIYALLELRHSIIYRQWPIWCVYILLAVLLLNWLLKLTGI